MGKNIIKPLPIIMMFLALFVTGCYDPRDQEKRIPEGLGSYDDIRPYTFDPETILAALDRGDEEIFQPLSDRDQKNVFPSGSFTWRQQDYLKIASALNRFANQDNLEEWSVYRISSFRDCTDNPIGFDDSFSITYFKIDGDRYGTRIMDIRPLAKEADWGGNMDFPRQFMSGWESIDLEKLKVTTDDALQIAEANGGKAVRQAANNDCSIIVILSPNVYGADWVVDYASIGSLFQISIDPYSGEYQIISDK